MTVHKNREIVLTGDRIELDQIISFGADTTHLVADVGAFERVERGHRTFLKARDSRPVYGANTGVGANKSIAIDVAETSSLGLRLLRSHCAATGPVENAALTRTAMGIRLNQLLAGESGASPLLVGGLAAAMSARSIPLIHRWGSLGTGDITQLAELALTLSGERQWVSNAIPPVPIMATDALPFMSSNAFTLARAAQGAADCRRVLSILEQVAALTWLAVAGCREAWDPRVHASRGHPHQIQVATRIFEAVRPLEEPSVQDVRVQDPFSLRTLPSVHAPAHDALTRLTAAVELECSSGLENPLVVGDELLHHGLFHQATLSALLDQVRSTLVSVLNLASARVSMLNDVALNGSSRFLAAHESGSSGLMIGEYVVQDALATARSLAYPTAHSAISISLGTEEHASFSTHGARQLTELIACARVIVAAEAAAATRALRLQPTRQRRCRAMDTFALLDAALDPDMSDRPMGEDLQRADLALWRPSEVRAEITMAEAR